MYTSGVRFADCRWAAPETAAALKPRFLTPRTSLAVSRSFRLFGKKRGHRHSRSKLLGSAGEALFFTILLAAGTAFLVLLLVHRVIPEWRANFEFVEHTALVLEKKVGKFEDQGRLIYRPEVKIRYQVDGREYELWTYDIIGAYSNGREDKQSLIDRVEVGRQYKCWYDPLNPNQAVIVRGYTWWFWIFLLVPAGFIIIGGVGLVFTLWHWGKSPEHRAAQGQLAQLDLFEELNAWAISYPAVPHDANITNSPGTRLKYRLPMDASQGWRLFAATLTCLLWNGTVAALVIVAIQRHLRGEPDWVLDVFVLPFLAVGGFLIYYFVRELLIATGVGPTQIEISDHPLIPGQRYQLYLSQTGHLAMNALDVTLECEEVATYRQGTDSRTERLVVFREHVFRKDNFDIVPGAPFEASCEMSAPQHPMHSFRADHNEVQWKLVVRGDAAGWPKFERSFPVVVYPRPHVPDKAQENANQQGRTVVV